MKIDHIGIKTLNINQDLPAYLDLGYTIYQSSVIDFQQNVKILFIENPESKEKLELIESLSPESSVGHSPLGLHHICYDVSENKGFFPASFPSPAGKIIYGPLPAPALYNRFVVFAMLKTGVLAEYIIS